MFENFENNPVEETKLEGVDTEVSNILPAKDKLGEEMQNGIKIKILTNPYRDPNIPTIDVVNPEQSKTPEQFPSQTEIKSKFDAFLSDKKYTEYKELKILNDEKGVSLYEIEITLEDGEKVELNYQRAKYDYTNPSLPSSARFSASIHAIYYDEDGIPCDGECIANYLDGEWEMVS